MDIVPAYKCNAVVVSKQICTLCTLVVSEKRIFEDNMPAYERSVVVLSVLVFNFDLNLFDEKLKFVDIVPAYKHSAIESEQYLMGKTILCGSRAYHPRRFENFFFSILYSSNI